MTTSRRIGAVLATLALGASACSFGTADAEEPAATPAPSAPRSESNGIGPEGTGPAPANVSIATRVAVDTFDPIMSLGDSGAQQAFALAYETLVRLGPDGSIVAGAASRWVTDGATATFTIKPGLTCADGTPLDAVAVAESLRTFGAEGAMTSNVAFGGGGLSDVTVDETDQSVTVVLNAPYNDMLIGLTSSAFLVCPAGLADRDGLKTAPNGSGPYELISTTSDGSTFRRRDNYANLPDGTAIGDLPATITLTTIADDGTAADLLGQGRLNIAGTQSSVSEFLATDPALVNVNAAGFGTNAVTMMQNEGAATADPNLRKAIAMLLDSEAGGAAATSGQGISRRTLLTPNLACYDEKAADSAPVYGQAAGAAALDAAGYVIGDGGFRTRPDGSPLVLNVVGNNLQGTAPQYIASQLEKASIRVELFMGTYNESIAKLLSNEFDIGLYPFVSTYPAPSSWSNQIGSNAPANFSGVSNPTFDTLAARAQAATPRVEDYCSLWHEAERAVLEAANVVPFAQPVNHWFGHGVTFNATYFIVDVFSIRSY